MALPVPLRMIGRSLFVQASWSFERLQAPGFFLTVLPALRRRGAAGSAGAGPPPLRHLETFNTHPYFAGLVAATVACEEGPGGEGALAAAGLKRSLMCALGGIGDDLFWAHLRPAAALAALPLALAGSPWAVAVFLAVYDLPHLAVRAWGVAAGLRRGRGILTLLQSPALTRIAPAIAFLLPALAGLVLGLLASSGAWALPLPGATAATAGALLLFLVFLGFEAWGLPPGALLATAAALAFAAGLAGEVFGP